MIGGACRTLVRLDDRGDTSGGVGRQVVTRLRAAWPVLRWVLLAAVLAFVGYKFAGALASLDTSQLRLRPGYLVLSATSAAAVFTVLAVGYKVLLSTGFGLTVPTRAMAAAAWVPQLGKYVPGKVAAVAAAVGLLRRSGVPAAVALACYGVLDGCTVVMGLCLAAPLLTAEAVRAALPGAPLIAAALVLGGVVVLTPPVFNRILGLGLRLTGRPAMGRRLKLVDYLTPLLSSAAQWGLCGVALWAMCAAVLPEPPSVSALPWFVSAAGLAITTSYLALFAPGGAGVREGMYFAGLSVLGVPGELAAVVAILMRLQSITVEVLLAAIGLWLMHTLPPAGVEEEVDEVESPACPTVPTPNAEPTTASSAG